MDTEEIKNPPVPDAQVTAAEETEEREVQPELGI